MFEESAQLLKIKIPSGLKATFEVKNLFFAPSNIETSNRFMCCYTRNELKQKSSESLRCVCGSKHGKYIFLPNYDN